MENNNTNTATASLTGIDKLYIWVDAQCIRIENSISKIVQGFLNLLSLTTTAQPAAPQTQAMVTPPAIVAIPVPTVQVITTPGHNEVLASLLAAIRHGPQAIVDLHGYIAYTGDMSTWKEVLTMHSEQISERFFKTYGRVDSSTLFVDIEKMLTVIEKPTLYVLLEKSILDHVERWAENGAEEFLQQFHTLHNFIDVKPAESRELKQLPVSAHQLIEEARAYSKLLSDRFNPLTAQEYLQACTSRPGNIADVPMFIHPSECTIIDSTRSFIVTVQLPYIAMRVGFRPSEMPDYALAIAHHIKAGRISAREISDFFGQAKHGQITRINSCGVSVCEPKYARLLWYIANELYGKEEHIPADVEFRIAQADAFQKLERYAGLSDRERSLPGAASTREEIPSWIRKGYLSKADLKRALGVEFTEKVYGEIYQPTRNAINHCRTMFPGRREQVLLTISKKNVGINARISEPAFLDSLSKNDTCRTPVTVEEFGTFKRAQQRTTLPQCFIINSEKVFRLVREVALREVPATDQFTLLAEKYKWYKLNVITTTEALH